MMAFLAWLDAKFFHQFSTEQIRSGIDWLAWIVSVLNLACLVLLVVLVVVCVVVGWPLVTGQIVP